jgi:nucleoside-diphosphate-sugar epimerase
LQTSLKSALVTGANGFVGRHLTALLDSHGWRVVAAVRERASAIANLGVQIERLNLSEDADRWQSALRSVRCVVHLAARVHQMSAAGRAEEAFYEVNDRGTRFVAQQAALAGVRRFVLLSTIKVNGEGDRALTYRAEDIPCPQDSYGRSKLAGEIAAREVCLLHRMECVIVRPPLVYGPGVGANFRRLMKLVDLGVPLPFRSVDNQRSLVGIRNLCDFIETCMLHPEASGKTWLVSDGIELSTAELVRKLAKNMSRRPMLFSFPSSWLRILARRVGRGDEFDRLTNSLQLDIAPAMSDLNWRPQESVDEGLAATVAAYKLEK